MNDVFLSFIIPIFNAEGFVNHCVESILEAAQEGVTIEIILIDDGSEDGSLRKCQLYADRYENIHVFHQANAGVSTARNIGLAAAEGEYICFVDADDAVVEDYMKVLVEALRNSEVDMIQIGYSRVTASTKSNFVPNKRHIYTDLNEYFDKERYTHGVWSYIIKRSVIVENNLKFDVNLRYSEDQDLLNMCFLHAKSVMTLPYVLYEYNDVATSAVNKPVGKHRALAQLHVIKNLVNYKGGMYLSKYHEKIISQLIDDFCIYAKRSNDYTLKKIVTEYVDFYEEHFAQLPISLNKIKQILSIPKSLGLLFIPYSKLRNKLRTKNIYI